MSTLPKITLHWLELTRCFRTIWLLEELGLKYTIIPHDKKGKVKAPKDMYDVHPLGKGPVIELDYGQDKEKIILAESGHIFQYMIQWFDKQKKFHAETEKGARAYNYYLHFAEGSLQPPITFEYFLPRLVPDCDNLPQSFKDEYPQIQKYFNEIYILPKEREMLDFLEGELAKQKAKYGNDEVYFVENKFSGADIMLGFEVASVLFGADVYKEVADEKRLPLLAKWVKYAAYERPAYKKAVSIEEEIIKSGYKVYKKAE